MKMMRVAPAPGRAVPDPELGGLLADEGRDVPVSQYWMRRLRDGDVVKQDAAQKPAAADKKGV